MRNDDAEPLTKDGAVVEILMTAPFRPNAASASHPIASLTLAIEAGPGEKTGLFHHFGDGHVGAEIRVFQVVNK